MKPASQTSHSVTRCWQDWWEKQMPGDTLWTVIQADVGQAVLTLAVPTAVLSGLCGWAGGWVKDRQLARYKAKLDRDAAVRQAELAATTERVKSELSQETESHKLALKKEELLFNKALDAMSDLSTLRRKIEPGYSHPDMDHMEAMEGVAASLGNTERSLWTYFTKHGHVLPENIRQDLLSVCNWATNHKFIVEERGDFDEQVAGEVSAFLDRLASIEVDLYHHIQHHNSGVIAGAAPSLNQPGERALTSDA